MKKLSIIAVLLLSVIFFSCNNTQNNTNQEDTDTTSTEEVSNEDETTNNDNGFQTFWNDFQAAVAADGDMQEVFVFCSPDVEEYIIISEYGRIFDDKMKSEIANTKAADIEILEENKRLFSFTVEETIEGEVFESTYGFIIEKTDGKWLLSKTDNK